MGREIVVISASVLLVLGLGTALNVGHVGQAVIGLFSRIDRHALLAHPVRVGIHACVRQKPGITIKEISRTQGIGWGSTVYHLRRLEQARLLVSRRHRQFRRFYDIQAIGTVDHEARIELIHPTAQRIVAQVVRNPGASQGAIAGAVGISPAAAHKYLGRLELAGLVTRHKDVKRVRYFPTRQLIDLRLMWQGQRQGLA